jgi:uncharacterized protein YjlB
VRNDIIHASPDIRARRNITSCATLPVVLARLRLIMALLDTIKGKAERLSGLGRPGRKQARSLVRERKPNATRLADDGFTPNHPRWPLIIYRSAVRLTDDHDPAAVMEDLFEGNGWGDSWRDGIYDYLHYHSRIHEVLGVARGKGQVRFGGDKGRIYRLKAGDVAVLPAGTGHQCLDASKDFLVVGAYPPSGTYDECTELEDHARALKTIPKVARPRKDPLYGVEGPLLKLWRKA